MIAKIPTSLQLVEYFLIANLIIKNKIIGRHIINSSANDMGRILVRVAKIPRTIDEMYLLKKSANATFDMAIIKMMSDKAAIPKKTYAIFGIFILLFSGIINSILSKIFVYDSLHIVGERSVKLHFLLSFRMLKAKLVGVKCVSVN